MLYSKYEYSEGKMGGLTGFGGRPAPNMICGHQAHPSLCAKRKIVILGDFFKRVRLWVQTLFGAPHTQGAPHWVVPL